MLNVENKVIEEYFLMKGLVKITIEFFKYHITEPYLNDDLRRELEKLKNYVIFEDFYVEGRDLSKDFEKVKQYVKEKLPKLSEFENNILSYYLLKELTYKDLLPLFIDPSIEDITTKENNFIHIYHDKFGWLKTNIFLNKEEAEKLTALYAEKAYTFVSLANPFGEGILPNKDRFAAIFRLEESGFTIRRFKKKKFSIIDIINYGTLDIKTAAYLWLIIENPVICKLIINGPTGSGKTTFLNSVLNFIPVNKRIVAIEERVSELNIPLENYFVIITDSNNPRKSAFQALVNTLRQRPDYIVVGEIRGKETKIFFQALNSVAYDEPVLLRNKKTGEIILTKIGEFIDKFYRKDEERIPKVFHNDYNVKDWQVLALDKNKKVKFCDIKYVLRHKANEIYKIKTYGGGEIKLTGNHSIFVLNRKDLSIKVKKVSELKKEDLLITFVGIDEEINKNLEINLTKYKTVRSYIKNNFIISSSNFFNLNNDIIKKFLEGYMADGTRTLKKDYNRYSSKKRDLLVSLSWLCRVKGFYTRISKSGNHFLLDIYMNKPELTKSYTLPVEPFIELINQLEPKNMPYRLTYILKRKNINIYKAKEFLNWIIKNKRKPINSTAEQLINNIKAIVEGKIKVLRIKEIKKENYEGYVYDFSTEAENFFAGEIPILVHNTGHAGLTTFHSKNLNEMINRLTSSELGIEEKVIHSLKTAIFIGYQGVSKRKIYSIYEITENDYIEVAKFNSVENKIELYLDKTEIFKSLQEVTGLSIKTLKQDYLFKILFLYYLKYRGIREKEKVDEYFYYYYTEPYKLAKEIMFFFLKERLNVPELKFSEIKKLEKAKNPYAEFKEII